MTLVLAALAGVAWLGINTQARGDTGLSVSLPGLGCDTVVYYDYVAQPYYTNGNHQVFGHANR